MQQTAFEKSQLSAYAKKSRAAFEELLKEFVEVPSVSVDPTRRRALDEGANLAAHSIRRFGGEAAVLETGGAPIVHGRWGNDPSRPTVTVYNHLDVQPASKATEPWDTEPFTFVKKGDRY